MSYPIPSVDADNIKEEDVCEHCLGTGEVSEDVLDPDSHELMRGVGTKKCICRLQDDKYNND